MSFAKKFRDKHGKKLIDTATKTGIDAAKTDSKRVVQKTVEATGDLIGNKIADKITSVGKAKESINKPEEIYILPEKRHQIIDDLRLFWIIIIIIKKIFSIDIVIVIVIVIVEKNLYLNHNKNHNNNSIV